ncbi:MAG: L-seryl-tRNA(Sec) selenium transferase [Myxococcota bacterium]
MNDPRRRLPNMQKILDDPRLLGLPRALCKALARQVLDGLRANPPSEDEVGALDVVQQVHDGARGLLRGRQRAVINATGVVLHTNLGRAPWPQPVRDAANRAMGYGNVELDLATGKRGGRLEGLSALMTYLTGCESAIVVNNGAAAVLLALTAHARGQEVLVSRGELVEIGGSFRVPDVIASGGADLVDVGTTNRTRIADYAGGITQNTAVLLRVHTSNFKVVGFTEEPTLDELVALSREHGLRVVHDVGSGSLDGWRDEPSVRASVAAGTDVVIFSGDKLLGGPQAGILCGDAEAIEICRKHPLYRALRVDKVTLAAIEATLAMIAAETPPTAEAMLHTPLDVLKARAQGLAASLSDAGIGCGVEAGESRAGGGSPPGEGLDSFVVRVPHRDPEALHRRLRLGEPAVVARVGRGALLLDVRTLNDAEIEQLPAVLADAGAHE